MRRQRAEQTGGELGAERVLDALARGRAGRGGLDAAEVAQQAPVTPPRAC